MALLLSHWHCILPLAAILIGVLIMDRSEGKKKNSETTRSRSADEKQP